MLSNPILDRLYATKYFLTTKLAKGTKDSAINNFKLRALRGLCGQILFWLRLCLAGIIDLHSLRIAVRVLLALVAIRATNSHLPLHLAQQIDVRNLSDCDVAGVAALAAGAVFEI